MTLEPASSGHQSVSPSSSGRASPIPRKWRYHLDGNSYQDLSISCDQANLILDDHPRKDKAYRRYAAGVEKSLSLFDTTLLEWADYISFLGRLLKVRNVNSK